MTKFSEETIKLNALRFLKQVEALLPKGTKKIVLYRSAIKSAAYLAIGLHLHLAEHKEARQEARQTAKFLAKEMEEELGQEFDWQELI